ncbi:hypothetical protein AU375_06462 [Methylobacterium radiotolerans]|nr:hypothetical protein AU375_06462 [Methylobacterium radiotolerans]
MARTLGDLGQRVAVAADLGDLGLGVGIVRLLVRLLVVVGLVLVVLRLVLILVVVGLLVVLLGGLVRRVGGGRRGGLLRLARLRRERVRDGLARRVGHGQRLRDGDAGLRLGQVGSGLGGDRFGPGGGGLRLDRSGLGQVGSGRVDRGLGGARRLAVRRDVAGGGLGGEGLLHGLGVLGERVGLDGRVDPRLVPDLGLILALGGRVRVLGAHGLVGAAGTGLGAAAAGPARRRPAATLLALAVLLGVAGLLLEERLPVGQRDLVVVGMDLVEGQEAVAVAAILDERRLERRLNPGDLGEVDVAAQLAPVGGFEVELLDPRPVDRDDPGLLRVHRVDQHFVGHVGLSAWRPTSFSVPVVPAAPRPTSNLSGGMPASSPRRMGSRGNCRQPPFGALGAWG